MDISTDVENIIQEFFLAHILTDDIKIYKSEVYNDFFINYKNTRICRIIISKLNNNQNCILLYPNIKTNTLTNSPIICETKNDLIKHLNYINQHIEQILQIAITQTKNNFI